MGQYTGLNLTPLGEVYIFEKIKGPLINKQNSTLGIDCVVAYEVVKVAGFFIVFQGGQRPSTRILNFFIFRKNESAMELFNMIFENTSPKGSFWQNKINYDILQLSADSRYLWWYVLKNPHSFLPGLFSPLWRVSVCLANDYFKVSFCYNAICNFSKTTQTIMTKLLYWS